ncbi:UNVERIFIED_CONTAM: hypothetical protein Sradi_6177900 [Sesamum radiatum]|uniref:Uncharacterized protein n=1 Tax=Sesamum radiatum TaxID=300843 RepID=A0AAW2KB97_SESRA
MAARSQLHNMPSGFAPPRYGSNRSICPTQLDSETHHHSLHVSQRLKQPFPGSEGRGFEPTTVDLIA